MSVSMTIDAVRARQKTVTRRHVKSWQNLKPGDRLTLIEKGMGLAKGEKQAVICDVEIVDVRVEPLSDVTPSEVFREGLWDRAIAECRGSPMTTDVWFARFWLASHGYPGHVAPVEVDVRRIEFRYLDEGES